MATSDNVIPLQPRRRKKRTYGPLLLVCAAVVASLALLLLDFRLGAALLAGSVVLALVLRLTLTTEGAGMLVVRTRAIDVAVLSVLAVGLAILAIIVPPPPS